GDGDLDLAYCDAIDDKVSVRKNNGAGVFGAQAAYDIEAAGAPRHIATADVDGDGEVDIYVTPQYGPGVVVLYGVGGGLFDGLGEQLISFSANTYQGVIADFNGDGEVDVAVSDHGNEQVAVRLGAGPSEFNAMIFKFPTAEKDPYPLVMGDYNADGIPDLATTNHFPPSTIDIFIGDGDGLFYDAVSFPALPYGWAMDAGDLNEDGIPDLVAVASEINDFMDNGLTVLLSDP
ncbi:MAG: VCBS repeat-containing protein, partial [Myxococcales bacterium]|nr:VCBS repeat-containing protein [Myxococcales bacterium]